MAGLRRAERERRQQFDPDDPDDTVYIRSTVGTSSAYTYHDDDHCKHLRQSGRQRDGSQREFSVAEERRYDAQRRRRLAPCAHCVLDGGVLDG